MYIDQIFFDKLDINNCILSVGHVRKKMEMLENNQQDTESLTALVEDRMDVVQDRVNVSEDSVYHLQGDLSILSFFLNTFYLACLGYVMSARGSMDSVSE